MKGSILKYWRCREETPQVEEHEFVAVVQDARPTRPNGNDTAEDARPLSVDDNVIRHSDCLTSNRSSDSTTVCSSTFVRLVRLAIIR